MKPKSKKLLSFNASFSPSLSGRVPKRWVKFVVAWFLLVPSIVLTQAFFKAFTRATLQQGFWITEEFWFFSLGVVLWLIIFLGLPKPVWLYVFGHELTHAVWVLLMGGHIFKFKVKKTGGYVLADRINTGIALAPYFFPLYSFLVIIIYGVAGLFGDVSHLRQLAFVFIGGTWAFHLTFTCWAIWKGQQDLSYGGTFFSLTVIYLANLFLLIGMLIMASPEESVLSFMQDFFEGTLNLFQFIALLLQKI